MSGAPLRTVPHLLHTLMVPVLLLANLVLLVGVLVLLAGGIMSPATWSLVTRPETALDWYWLTFALAMFLTVSVYARRERGLRAWRVVLLGHAFAIYSLLWVVAGYWALARIIRGKRGWLKTERLADRPARQDPHPAADDAR